MAAATVNKQWVSVQGPFKLEFVNLTADDTNTYTTIIQSPQYAMAVNNEDTDTTSAACSAAISGRTVTLNNANLSSSEVNVLIFGF